MGLSAAQAKALGIDLAAVGFDGAEAKVRRGPKPKAARPPLEPGTMILAADVSSKAAGLAVVVTTATAPHLKVFGLIEPTASWPLHKRVDHIYDRVAKFASEVGRVDLAILEWADGANWSSKGRAPAWAHLVVSLVAAQAAARQAVRPHATEIEVVSSTEWSGGCSKDDRADRIRLLYPAYAAFAEQDPGRDVADAIGLAFWRCGRR